MHANTTAGHIIAVTVQITTFRFFHARYGPVYLQVILLYCETTQQIWLHL